MTYMNKITIDLLRHGDAAGGSKLLGQTDEPLSALGLSQMRAVPGDDSPPWSKVISSPLSRCSSFAQELSDNLSLPLLIEPSFQEINFGIWDGEQLTSLYESEHAEQLMQFMAAPSSITPPEGESYQDFKHRVLSAWDNLLQSLHQDKIEHCVLITHAGVIRTIISHVLGFPEENLFRLEVPYANLSRITQYEDYPPVLSFHGGQL
ncbi:MAG: hypothetical protein COA90_01840 [Gammaproteobacteria bacterium]|nr:MAG: hypothetical protein COA90_01840 [Gammaproteobacteria bacterium]